MPRPIIEIDGIGKRYRIRGQRGRSNYLSLRDEIARPFKRLMTKDRKTKDQGRNVDFWALKDVSFSVNEGEAVGIIGRNGAGKSTLLKILSQITPPTEGRITMDGRVASLLEVGTGFHPELTGRENVYLNGAILGMSRSEVKSKFDEIVAFAEVEKFLDTPVKRYSSGMYVRLAFAVAAHLEPEILLVDEVLAVGDTEFQKKCLGKMEDVAKGGRTVLFVSHNMGAIQMLCPRAVLLDRGGLMLDGSASDVTKAYQGIGLARDGERTWSDPMGAPGDDVVRLRSVRVCNNRGELRTVFTVRDPVVLEVEYDVLQSSPLDVYFYVHSEAGICVFVSMDNNHSPWRDTSRPIGHYRGRCHIPGDFLNVGRFAVMAVISQNLDRSLMHAKEQDAISFVVDELMDEAGVRGNFNRRWPPSEIRPRLEWDVELLEPR